MTKKTSLTLIPIVIIFLAISSLAGVVWVKTRPAKNYADMNAFSVAWMACRDEDRNEMLDWLLGQKPTPYTAYPVGNTQLDGLTRDQVKTYLGPGGGQGEHYRIGSIEKRFISDIIYPTGDMLIIGYDANDVVAYIDTTN